MKKVLLALTLISFAGCIINPNVKPTVDNTVDAKTEVLQLTEAEWASAKEFKAAIEPTTASKEDLYSVVGVLYGIAEVLQSELTEDNKFIYNVQVDDLRLKAINIRFNGKSITDVIPGFLDKVKGKFDFLTPGDAELTADNKAKAISQFKVLAGGVYLAAQGK